MRRIWFYLLLINFLLVLSCDKEKNVFMILKPGPVYGSISDKDGNTYKTLLIGTQTWMVKNLKTTKYNDGTLIPFVSDVSSWSNLTSPGYCWPNDFPAYKASYGILYNWYAVSSNKLCPVGWHIPTDQEWNLLITYFGGEMIAGGMLKESSLNYWKAPNTGASNMSHFWGLPGGRIESSDSSFQKITEMGCWWTNTSHNKDMSIAWVIYYNNESARKVFYPKKFGLSVRCIWDY